MIYELMIIDLNMKNRKYAIRSIKNDNVAILRMEIENG